MSPRKRGPIPVSTVSTPKTGTVAGTKSSTPEQATATQNATLAETDAQQQDQADAVQEQAEAAPQDEAPAASAADGIPEQTGGDRAPAKRTDGDKRPGYLRNFGGDQEQPDAVEALRLLAQELPADADVREVDEDDTSPLQDIERQQRERTEHVIQEAMRTGDAVVWVLAQGVSLAVKGKWHRDTGQSLDDYVKGLTKRSASYFRRLRQATPLALEAAERFGKILVPGPTRDLVKIEQQHGRKAALDLYDVLQEEADEAGREVTAAVIAKAGDALPAALPDEEKETAVAFKKAARAALSVPIGTHGAGQGGTGAGANGGGGAPAVSTRIPVTVPKEVSDTLDKWAEVLTEHLHGITVSPNDIIKHSLALATSQEQQSLGFIAEWIEKQHAAHVGKGVIRFEWRAGGYARTAERRDKGHGAKKGETPYSCTHEEKETKDAPLCGQLAVWKVTRTRRKQTTAAFFCDAHLPDADTPPGRWKD